MSAIPVMMYLAGIPTFGLLYWLMDGIMDSILSQNVHVTGDVFDLGFYLWAGMLIVYLIFGGIWVVRKYDEAQYQRENK